MKHHVAGRPIGKCKGCCLNMRSFCAAGLEPKSEWSRGRCRSWGDGILLEAFYRPAEPTGGKAAKLARRARAVQAATAAHRNGRISPGRYAPTAQARV